MLGENPLEHYQVLYLENKLNRDLVARVGLYVRDFINDDKVYSIVPSKIFEMFINEFSDKQEMIKVLAEDSSVKKSVHDLSDKDKPAQVSFVNKKKNKKIATCWIKN